MIEIRLTDAQVGVLLETIELAEEQLDMDNLDALDNLAKIKEALEDGIN